MHICICDREFESKKSLIGHKTHCAVYRESVGLKPHNKSRYKGITENRSERSKKMWQDPAFRANQIAKGYNNADMLREAQKLSAASRSNNKTRYVYIIDYGRGIVKVGSTQEMRRVTRLSNYSEVDNPLLYLDEFETSEGFELERCLLDNTSNLEREEVSHVNISEGYSELRYKDQVLALCPSDGTGIHTVLKTQRS